VDASTHTMSVVWDQIRAGKVRFIMVYSDKRYHDMQDVPTARELGFPDAAMTSFWGTYVLKDMPESIEKVLSDPCKRVYEINKHVPVLPSYDPYLIIDIDRLVPSFALRAHSRANEVEVRPHPVFYRPTYKPISLRTGTPMASDVFIASVKNSGPPHLGSASIFSRPFWNAGSS
jgi:hypothetical protein